MQLAIAALLLMLFAWLSVWRRKLTPVAGFAGWAVAMIIYAGAGWMGIALLGTFFFLGTLTTAIGLHSKQANRLALEEDSRRKAGQVWANAGVPAILCACVLWNSKWGACLHVGIAAAFASAAADTASSELGNVYGRRFYNIISWRKDQRGRDGVVSAEGTLFGVLASVIIAAVYASFASFDSSFMVIVVAGTVGNLFDSVLGATLERRDLLSNDQVNFLNTFVAAAFAAICG